MEGVFNNTVAEWIAAALAVLTTFVAYVSWMVSVDTRGKSNTKRLDGIDTKLANELELDRIRDQALARIDAGVAILLKKDGLN